jgi:hypothetical protein
VPHALGQRVSFVEGEGPRLDALNDHLHFKIPEMTRNSS